MNTHSTRTRRPLAALAAGGVLTLATALPATAVVLPDPIGNGSSVVEPPGPFDDNALEFVQIGLGALGGIGLAGAGVAVMRARRHHHPQLA
jgi:hypothetical protein